MATKRGNRSGTKVTAKRSGKAARPAAREAERRKPAKAATKPAAKAVAKPAARRVAVAPARREVTGGAPSLMERAKALRDAIQRSKLTAADPWAYTPKARAWLARSERLLDQLSANVETAEMRKAVEALAAAVEADRDFREARRFF